MLSPIVAAYWICLGIGVSYVLISFLLGEVAGHFDIGAVDHGGMEGHDGVLESNGSDSGSHVVEAGDGASMHMPILSPLIIATFLAVLGGMGLVAWHMLGYRDYRSFVFAGAIAVLLSGGMYVLVDRFLYRCGASSEATIHEILGAQAEVITSIPEQGLGEIAYACKGFRYNSPAKSYDGQPVAKGSKVRIVKAEGSVLTVKTF